MGLDSIKQQIREEIATLSQVLRLLEGGKRKSQPRGISAAGRKRIAAAQRARWAKFRTAKK